MIGADLYVFKYISQRKGIFQEELIQNLKEYMKQEGLIKDEEAEEWSSQFWSQFKVWILFNYNLPIIEQNWFLWKFPCQIYERLNKLHHLKT